MALAADTCLWAHWKFNADQRLKAFDKSVHPLILIFLGGFVSLPKL